ncbi:hypothetical protein N8703_02840 [Verrucomicrobia bacterium]|nr:hypothetical protein [Verrucomicrobiota bacterium]
MSVENSDIIFEQQNGHRTYLLKSVDLGKGEYLALRGSKKGSRYLGGDIAVPDLLFLDQIVHLIHQIASLTEEPTEDEAKVCFFNHRGKTVTGEIRNFDDDWFYRVKCYQNYFTKDGKIKFYKGHMLKPAGYGFYIQEFDFPLSAVGIHEALTFAERLQNAVHQQLIEKFKEEVDDVLELMSSDRLLVGGETVWIDSEPDLDALILHKPLFELTCDKLREQPLTPDSLSTHLGLTPEAGERQLHPNSRYDLRFLDKGFLLDRVRKGFTSLHYLITQIPQEALEQSPALTYLFKEDPPDNWEEWRRATFSNDEYSTGKLQSYHIAQVELDAYEGGLEMGIEPQSSQMRATAIRLFDLKRYHQRDAEKSEEVQKLIDRYTAVTAEADYA